MPNSHRGLQFVYAWGSFGSASQASRAFLTLDQDTLPFPNVWTECQTRKPQNPKPLCSQQGSKACTPYSPAFTFFFYEPCKVLSSFSLLMDCSQLLVTVRKKSKVLDKGESVSIHREMETERITLSIFSCKFSKRLENG